MSHVLVAVATSPSGGHGSSSPIGFIIVGIGFILIGGMNAISPGLGFRLNRWQYKNKEAWQPSNAALVVARITGCIAVVIGIVLLILAATR